MVTKQWNPLRLAVSAFVRDGASLAGEWPAHQLPRFCSGAPECPPDDWAPVRWKLRGEVRPVRAGEPELWMRLRVDAQAHLTCQRCLQPVDVPLQVDRWFLFARDEAQAAALDAEREEDVLVASSAFDVREWVEDELLLALPIVPMHASCPQPLLTPVEPTQAPSEPGPAHPFAALEALKRKPSGGAA